MTNIGDVFADDVTEIRTCGSCGLPLSECDCGDDVADFDDFDDDDDDEYGDDDDDCEC